MTDEELEAYRKSKEPSVLAAGICFGGVAVMLVSGFFYYTLGYWGLAVIAGLALFIALAWACRKVDPLFEEFCRSFIQEDDR